MRTLGTKEHVVLVLSRRPQQSLLIGTDVVVTVLEVNGDTVRIGITAPPEVDIHREEVYLDLKKSNADAATSPGAAAALSRRMKGRSERRAADRAEGRAADRSTDRSTDRSGGASVAPGSSQRPEAPEVSATDES